MAEQIVQTKLIVEASSGKLLKHPVTLNFTGNRIEFVKSPFALKDEIKAMKGSRWHGFEAENPRKIWSVKDCERNRFQLKYMMGGDPYEWWSRDLIEHEYDRPLRAHQCLMTDHMLTYHFAIIAAEMGTGKTLSAIEAMEKSGIYKWWWVAPKSGLQAVEREFDKWGLEGVEVEVMTYEALRSKMKNWVTGDKPPQGVVMDESSRLKNHQAQRSQAAQALADGIREEYGTDGMVILMSGTPSPKSPVDWFSQAEIVWPGFIREGDMKQFERRMAVFAEKTTSQGKHMQRVTWLDDEKKCAVCGEYEYTWDDTKEEWCDGIHQDEHDEDQHQFQPSFNEVAFLKERLDGLALVLHKKDCIDLPDKIYRTIRCEPTPTTTRVASTLAKIAPNAITGLTWLRELSDGFQYREIEDGMEKCKACSGSKVGEVWQDPEEPDRLFEMRDLLDPDYAETLVKIEVPCPRCGGTGETVKSKRVTKEVPCPKDHVLKQLLEENEEQGRLVVFAGFTGTLDRITEQCRKLKWAVVRVDGRGWKTFDGDGNSVLDVKPLDYWANVEKYPRVVFVAHPKSGGMSVTLTEARMAVFYSNDFNPESRAQAEDRIHRMGMDTNLGATIVDIIHLPTDERVRNILKDNRRLELMSMGEVEEILEL